MKTLIKKYQYNLLKLHDLSSMLDHIEEHNCEVGNCYIDEEFIDDEPIIAEIKATKKKIQILENTLILRTYFYFFKKPSLNELFKKRKELNLI